jgi:hypothetical protein
MNIPSTQSGHWTDDELLAFIYGVGPSGNHLDGCSECRTRLASMQANRESVERSALTADGINPAFLAAQRRGIYQRMEKPAGWWSAIPLRRWAAGVATTCVLCASLVVYQHNREAEIAAQERINDARLAQEVATMAQDTDVSSMAPLEGLFE